MKRLLPFPYLSLLLLIVWLLMNNSMSPGQILLGLIFALLIPLGTSSMRKNQPTLKKPLSAAKYLLMLMGDIIVSNVEPQRPAQPRAQRCGGGERGGGIPPRHAVRLVQKRSGGDGVVDGQDRGFFEIFQLGQ